MLDNANGNVVKTREEKDQMIQNIIPHLEGMLKELEFNQETDQNLHETPHRIAKMMVNEIFTGCYDEAPKITVFENTSESQDMVFLGNIDLFSTCSHHFKSFAGKCHIAYIPNDHLVGISKLARIADWFARRPQIQEELGAQIADFIEEVLQPKGCAVMIEAVHNCMKVRGARQTSSSMVTTQLRGSFRENRHTSDEFQRYVQNGKV